MLGPRMSAVLVLAAFPAVMWYQSNQRHENSGRSMVVHHANAKGQESGALLFERDFDVQPGGQLVVDVADADVRIVTGGENVAQVRAYVYARDPEWGRDVFQRSNFRAEQDGATIRVQAEDPRVTSSEWRRQRRFGITALVTIPERFAVDIRTGDGDISLERLNGDVAVSTGDGDVALGELEGGRIAIETSDGDIHARALHAAEVWLRTSDGDVTLGEVSGAVEARTSDGDVSLELIDLVGDVLVSTHDGDITIYAPLDVRANVLLRGEDLQLGRGFELLGNVRRRSVEGTLNGGGPRIDASSGDGEVRLRTR